MSGWPRQGGWRERWAAARRAAEDPYPRQVDVLAAFVEAGGSVFQAAARIGIRPSTAKRHLADLRARSGLTTEQLIYRGRAEGWLVVPTLERSSHC
jgi:predicted ArsR family transcriptional regulator